MRSRLGQRHGHTQKRRPCEDGGRDRNYADTNQGTPGPPEAEEARKDSPIEPSEEMWPCQHFAFELLVSRTVRQFLLF